MKSIRSGAYLPALGVIGLIIIWYVAVWYEVVDRVLLPSPTDTFRVDVPAEHLQSRDFPVSAGLHTLGAHVVGGFVWPNRVVTVADGAVLTDSLPFSCS